MDLEQQTDGPADVFQALERESTLTSRVIIQMEAMIGDGRLRDGSRLPAERDLARQFGVSRTVIREAVAALGAKELLQVEAGSGTTIRRPSLGAVSRCLGLHLGAGAGLDLHKVAEARRLLLSDTAGLAAERHSDEDLERLAGILKEAESERSVAVIFARWTASFHTNLARAAGNDVLGTTIALYDDLLSADTVKACDNVTVVDRWLRNLQSIMKPLKKGDAKSSRQSMRDMLIEVEDALVLTPTRRVGR